MSGLQPLPADDADRLRAYLRPLPVGQVRAMANGMRYRHESRKDEIVEWLVRYLPEDVRRHRDAARGD